MEPKKTVVRTLKFRVKDRHVKWLNAQARSINYVWNYCNDLTIQRWNRERKTFSGFDLCSYTAGSSKELGLNSQSVQEVCKEYDIRRQQFKKVRLNWRKSKGARRSLGWVPFKGQALKYKNGSVVFMGVNVGIWDSYGLYDYFKSNSVGAGSFNEDAQGRWYFNVSVTVEKTTPVTNTRSVGIDLGLKDFATTSDGEKIEAKQFYRTAEAKLGKAQRANKKKQVKKLHAKIKN